MASLQDQLLKAGLIDERKAKQAKQEKRKRKKKSGKASLDTDQQARAEAVAARRQAKAAEDRKANQQRQAAAERAAVQKQIDQLIQAHAIERSGAEQLYQFVHQGRIKRLRVQPMQADQLARGRLAITALQNGQYVLIPAEQLPRIRERLPERIVCWHDPNDQSQEDDYAEFPIPDDLDW